MPFRGVLRGVGPLAHHHDEQDRVGNFIFMASYGIFTKILTTVLGYLGAFALQRRWIDTLE